MSPPSIAQLLPQAETRSAATKDGSHPQSQCPKQHHTFPSEADSLAYAQSLDANCPMRKFRNEYIIPSKDNLKSKDIKDLSVPADPTDPAIYFCGNSLGLQPRRTASYISTHLNLWSHLNVHGHFRPVASSPLAPWQELADQASTLSAPIVGAQPSEVSMQNTLTVNLHLLLASFYQPTSTRHKILLEHHAFPSDHYAVESQIQWHGRDPAESMLLLRPKEGEHVLSTQQILDTITQHADEIALILLPGIQYYTGQFLDIPTITAHAHYHNLLIGWDLAHAAGNVPLQLHDWDVDFAAWCTYKYMNSGPGGMGGLFVHDRHGKVERSATTDTDDGNDTTSNLKFRHRLTGWYAGDRASRFNMDNRFVPIEGAKGFQVSNPSAIDLASLVASLSVFAETSMADLREKSLKITAYAEHLLGTDVPMLDSDKGPAYEIITPRDPEQRGAQLSVLFKKEGLLEKAGERMQHEGVVADQRKPDVCRVAPAPMYNSYEEVWRVVRIIKEACRA
ncbi:kynureninase [Cyphellophora europaea CBS 101466]|uniref:Kynureninase n=1 Tax=Cyphellophora europaea (strain CBS 101466) TaxID=1220924 RepID=W2RLP9_CYPE1|nr:kynureninase [Cyphellophora europaea CBS 101466]ETN37426.1 kynureninase [Cyphellophora europaea CBS 101466]